MLNFITDCSIQTRDVCLDSGRAVALAHSVFEMAKGKGFCMNLLDIGESFGKKSAAELSMKEVSGCCIFALICTCTLDYRIVSFYRTL